MAKSQVASPSLDPTDATLNAVQQAWVMLHSQRILIDAFRHLPGSGHLLVEAGVSARTVALVRSRIEAFCEQLLRLEVALVKREQDRPLRWMYDPHCVSCKGNVPEPFSRHDSYSQAVYRFALQTFQTLPFIESQEMPELRPLDREPGSPLPKIAFDQVFKELRGGPDAASGPEGEAQQECGVSDKTTVTSSTAPFEATFEANKAIRERVLSTHFDIAEIELLVRREYAAVADRTGSVRDTPIDPTTTRFSPWIESPELVTVMKANGLRKGNPTKGTSDRQVTRIKKRWGADFQPKTNKRVFRFRLDTLDELGIRYPEDWKNTPPVETE